MYIKKYYKHINIQESKSTGKKESVPFLLFGANLNNRNTSDRKNDLLIIP